MNTIRQHLDELDSFRKSPAFHEWGFSAGGPYHEWMQQLANAHRHPLFGLAASHLMVLGLDYFNCRGEEMEHTKRLRKLVLVEIERYSEKLECAVDGGMEAILSTWPAKKESHD